MSARISVDTDTWWHLRTGKWIVENQAFPHADPFSHTRYGENWNYPGWLVQTPMYLIYSLFGPGGLNLWVAAMVTLAFVFVWNTLTSGPFLRAFITILAATVSGVYWAARPYLVTFLLAAVFLWVLEAYRWRRSNQDWKRLWILPLLMVVWVNSHGGFAAGFLIWGVYVLNDLVDMLWHRSLLSAVRGVLRDPWSALRDPPMVIWLVGLAMLLATCLNPYGARMLVYPLQTVSIGALQDFIQEWRSPNFHQIHVQPFVWMLILTLGAIGASRRRFALTDFLLVGGFAYMGLLAARNIALFALAASPALSRYSSATLESWRRKLGWRQPSATVMNRKSWLNVIILIVLGLAGFMKLWMVLPGAPNHKHFHDTLPMDAVSLIQEQSPPGKIFNSYNWGGYLLWALPEYPVFVDGRTDLYNDELIDEWVLVMRAGDGWQDVLEQYGVNLILIEAGSTLDRVLEREQGWDRAYQDDLSVVYIRNLQ